MLTIRPYPATPHEWEDLACDLKHTHQVDPKNAFPFRSIQLLERVVATEIPGIVNEDVDAWRLTEDMRHSFCDLVRVRNIHLQGLPTVEFDWIDIPNPDISARTHELCRDSPANSPSTASDDGCLTGKIV